MGGIVTIAVVFHLNSELFLDIHSLVDIGSNCYLMRLIFVDPSCSLIRLIHNALDLDLDHDSDRHHIAISALI